MSTSAAPASAALATDKGLSRGSIGLLGSVVIGVSTIAPAYTLSGALGPTAAAVIFAYLARTHRRLLGLGEANPFSGAQLRRAVQFVESRASGRLDVAL